MNSHLLVLIAIFLHQCTSVQSLDTSNIKCPVCQESMDRLITHYKPVNVSSVMLEEFNSIKFVKEICDSNNESGEWTKNYDIVQQGSAYTLTQRSKEACDSDCELITSACKSIVDKYFPDITELINIIETKEGFIKIVCNEITKSC